MYLCLRVDLDYVPWDTPDANEFGHGEPAMILRLLDMARMNGHKLHFFASNRVLRAFPATAEAILNDGHHLDWFCKHPEAAEERATEAGRLFEALGNPAAGFCLRGAWQSAYDGEWATRFRFMSAQPGPSPTGVRLFPVETQSDRESVRSGLAARSWADGLKVQVREAASRNRGVTLVVRPQVLGKVDAKLSTLSAVLDLSRAVGLPNRTLREVLPP